MPRLADDGVSRPASVPLPMPVYWWTDCQSLLDHLLGEKQSGLTELRLWGYIRVLQEALERGDIKRAFHVGGPWNPIDPLTKKVDPGILLELIKTGVFLTGPGRYQKAAARKAADLTRERLNPRSELTDLVCSTTALWEAEDCF